MTFVLASNNLKKRREMGQILQAMGIQVLTMEEAGIHSCLLYTSDAADE